MVTEECFIKYAMFLNLINSFINPSKIRKIYRENFIHRDD